MKLHRIKFGGILRELSVSPLNELVAPKPTRAYTSQFLKCSPGTFSKSRVLAVNSRASLTIAIEAIFKSELPTVLHSLRSWSKQLALESSKSANLHFPKNRKMDASRYEYLVWSDDFLHWLSLVIAARHCSSRVTVVTPIQSSLDVIKRSRNRSAESASH